ncbi:EF-hand calcium-binding domain-containing protein 5-like [Heptranchias perlo]|uniref:EF-hand calcium-binding domain-containing protein 5-like n=1 Tax=Heptranchias perlo TaxID=212740 RepID=UPI003559A17B
MTTKPEDENEITSSGASLGTNVDQGIIASQSNSQNTATGNEEDQTKATTEAAKSRDSMESDDSKIIHPAEKRSHSLDAGIIEVVADEDDSKTFHPSGKRSHSLEAGIFEHVADEDGSKHVHVTESGAIEGVAAKDRDNIFHQAAKRKVSIDTRTTKGEADEDNSNIFHQAAKRKVSIETGTTKSVADENNDNFHQAVKRRVSIAESVTGEYGNRIQAGKKSSESVVDQADTQTSTKASLTKTSASSISKSRNGSKRASFQTSIIEGLSADDANEDDDSEGVKLLWKRIFERKVAKRVLNLQEQKSMFFKRLKHEKANLEKKVPMDLLTKEWFNENKMTVQTRIYILEKLLPTLILGLEKLLVEVEKKDLTVLEIQHPYFNPINFLAQYLMRNNPRYCNFPEEDPYMRGLKHVVEELKNHVVDIKDNRQDIAFQNTSFTVELSSLKAETKLRQKERERLNKIQVDNQEKRKENLRLQFRDWMQSTNGNVLLSLAQSVLLSFMDTFADYLFETSEVLIYDMELEEIDTTGQILNEEEFVKYMYSYVKGLPDDPFQDFLTYLSRSSDFLRQKGQNDWWRQKFAELFLACDVGKTGFLDRHRVILLFEMFYDSHPDINKAELHNPREWPIIELDEMEPPDFILGLGSDYISAEAPVDLGTEKEVTTGQEQTEVADQTPHQEEKQNGDSEEASVKESGEIAQRHFAQSSSMTDIGDLSATSSDGIVQDEWSVASSQFPDLKSIMLDIKSRGNSLITSPFDRNSVNKQQFVQLMETFVGDTTESSAVESLINYIQAGYGETKEEKLERLAQANRDALSATHKLILNALFEKWDIDVSGYINLRELVDVMSTYKDGMEKNALKKAHHKLKLLHKYYSDNPTLSKKEFRTYVETVAAEISGDKTVFENIVKFLMARNEQNCMERAKSSARRRWLRDIQQAAETSGSSMELVYKTVFQTLYKDSEAHGANKKISSSIALLKRNNHRPERGTNFLHYVACTLEDAPYVLNQALYRDMAGVSFFAVDEGKPVYILKVQEHGNVHFWNCHRDRTDGSFLVIPLKDENNRVFGVLGTDTLRDICGKYFTTHEINFHQGVAKAFSIAYHHVQVRRDILKAVDSAVLWLYEVAPCFATTITYLVQPITSKEYVLSKAMTTENDVTGGWSDVHMPPTILQKRDNFFRNYLFRCAETSEVVYSTTYKGQRVAVPLRDMTGRTLAVLDINLGAGDPLLIHEYRSLLKMLQILHLACNVIVNGVPGEKESLILEDCNSEERREKLLFHRLMLQELRDNIKNLNEQALVELKNSQNPPAMVHDIFKIVLHLLDPKLNVENITWTHCKEKLNSALIQEIYTYDPVEKFVNVDTHLLAQYFKGFVPGTVWKYGSLATYYLYHWAFICFLLIQLTTKLKDFYRPPSVCHLASI